MTGVVTRVAYSRDLNPWKYAALVEQARRLTREAIRRHTTDEVKRRRLCTMLKADRWAGDPYLSRIMRRYWARGKNRTSNQIVVRADQYTTWTLTDGGDVWVAVPGLERRSRVAIPLNTTVAPTGTLQLILRKGRVEVHHQVKAETLKVAEDLTKTFTGRKSLGRNMNRRLAAWTKGITAQALTDVSERRSSALRLVNAAYTSQVDPRTGLLALRAGDRLHLPGGVVMQADHAAAINILARDTDPDIGLRTPYRRVREILQERADRQRTRLPVQDSNPHPRVESEPSNPYLHASVGS